jgi:hypothetical protein
MNCLSSRAVIDEPWTPPLPSPAKVPGPELAPLAAQAGLLDVVVVGESAGIVGSTGDDPAGLTVGNTLVNGTAGVELTPRLLISNDPKGSPVRAAPPDTVGAVDVGADDAARLLDPEPHIPDIPAVSNTPEEATGICDATDVVDNIDVPDIDVVPDAAEVPVPTDMPPPSKLAADPNISEGGVATVGHAVLVVVVGIVIVPVTPVGSGLTPGETISVEPSGIPVGEPAPPVATPSGEVAPIVGVGVTVPSNCPSTCALAALQTRSAGRIAPIKENFIVVPS